MTELSGGVQGNLNSRRKVRGRVNPLERGERGLNNMKTST